MRPLAPSLRALVAALAVALPGVAGGELPRLAVVRADEAGDRTPLCREVSRALATALADVALEVPADDRCRVTDEGCLAALACEVGAPAILHVSLRPVGGTPTLLLVRVAAGAGSATTRTVQPLRPGVPVEAAVREAVFRLLAPARVAGALEVEATEGSEIWVDGERRGIAPLPVLDGLAPGQHLLRVVRPGGGEARGTVEVRFEGRTRVRIEPRSDQLLLVAHEATAPATEAPGAARDRASAPSAGAIDASARLAPAPPGGETPGDEKGLASVPPAAVAPAPESFPGWTVAGWSAVGTGAVLATSALIPALAAARARDEARALRDPAGRLPPSHAAEDRRLSERAEGHDATATALVAIGASLAASGVTVLLLDLDGDEP